MDCNDFLSDRELNVLDLLAVGKGNKEIGAVLNVTEETVKVQVRGHSREARRVRTSRSHRGSVNA